MRLKIYYILWNRHIKPWIKMEDGYYVFEDILIPKKTNKRSIIRRTLTAEHITVSYRINYSPNDPPIYSLNIESDELKDKLEKFRGQLYELEIDLLMELDKL